MENQPQPQPDDVVLMDAKSTLEMLVHKMVELQRRVEQLEANLAQIFGKGGTVQ